MSPWWERAGCRAADPELFFAQQGGGDHARVTVAKMYCAACPVVAECLADGADDHDGIRGGLTPDERRRGETFTPRYQPRGALQHAEQAAIFGLLPCGTHAAYNRHRKAGETACEACQDAEREYQRRRGPRVKWQAWRRARRAAMREAS